MPSGAEVARAFFGGGTRAARDALLDLQVALLLVALPVVQLWAWLVPDAGGPLPAWVASLWLAAFLTASLGHAAALGLAVAASVWLTLARWRRPAEAASRRDRLAYAALVVAGVMVAPFASELARGPAAPAGGTTLRVATANLLGHHPPRAALVEEIAELGADVLVLVEFTPRWQEALGPRLAAQYPHRIERPRRDAFGIAVYARRPLGPRRWLGELPFDIPMLRVEVDTPEGPVPLYAVHTMPPRTLEYVRWHREMVRILLRTLDEEPGPVVVVGDFNFGVNTPQHRALLGRGLRDGYSDGARGHGKTWPVLGFTRRLPGMRLDHVYARGFTCIEAGMGQGTGSDHRPVWTTWKRVGADQ